VFLLVNPNGSKLWRLKSRYGGKEKLLALGSFDLISLAEARTKRDSAKNRGRLNVHFVNTQLLPPPKVSR
jgi:hypothetical protein